jgi:hypothetical protein
MWPVGIMKVFCELARLNHAKYSKFALFGYEKKTLHKYELSLP